MPPSPSIPPTVTSRIGVPGQVVIESSGFVPAEITVRAGRPVTFLNDDAAPHRVVSVQPGVFDIGPIPPGGQASVTIVVAGFTDFHDADNPALRGTIRTLP